MADTKRLRENALIDQTGWISGIHFQKEASLYTTQYTFVKEKKGLF